MFVLAETTSKGLSKPTIYDVAQQGRLGTLYLKARGVDGIKVVPLSSVCEVDAYGKVRLSSRGTPIIKPEARPTSSTDLARLTDFLAGKPVSGKLYAKIDGKNLLIDNIIYQAVNTDPNNSERYYVDRQGNYVPSSRITPPAFKKMTSKTTRRASNRTLFETLTYGSSEYPMVALTDHTTHEKKFFRDKRIHCLNGVIYKGDDEYPRILTTSSSEQVGKVKQDIKLKLAGSVISTSITTGGNSYEIRTASGDEFIVETSADSVKIKKGGQECEFSTTFGRRGAVNVEDINLTTDGAGNMTFDIDVASDINYTDMSPSRRDDFVFDANNNRVFKFKTNGRSDLSIRDISRDFSGLEVLTEDRIEGVEFYQESSLYKRDSRTHEVLRDGSGKPVLEDDIVVQMSKARTDRSVEKVISMTPDDIQIQQAVQNILSLKSEISNWIVANDPDLVTKTENATKEIDKNLKFLEENLQTGDYENLLQLINSYRRSEQFPTFYFDENGEKHAVSCDSKVELASTPPFEFLGDKVYKKILGSNKVEYKKGKVMVNTNQKADRVAVNLIDAVGVMAKFCFGTGIFGIAFTSVLLAPMIALSLASGAVKLGAVIQAKIKQQKLKHLTPEKIRKKEIKATKKYVKDEIKKAEKEYNRNMRHAERTKTGHDLISERERLKSVFLKRKQELNEASMLIGEATINSRFDKTVKAVKAENLYGFAGAMVETKKIKKGVPLDYDAKVETKKAKNVFDQKYKGIKKLFAKKIDKVARKSPTHEFLVEHGPVKDRVKHLKKTSRYFLATKEDKKKMVGEQKEKDEKATSVTITSVDVKPHNKALKSIKKTIEKYTPKRLKGEEYEGRRSFDESVIKASADCDYLRETQVEASAVADLNDAVKTAKDAKKLAEELNAIDGNPDILDKDAEKSNKIRSVFSTTPPAPATTPRPVTTPSPAHASVPSTSARNTSRSRTASRPAQTPQPAPSAPTTTTRRASPPAPAAPPTSAPAPSARQRTSRVRQHAGSVTPPQTSQTNGGNTRASLRKPRSAGINPTTTNKKSATPKQVGTNPAPSTGVDQVGDDGVIV